MAIRFRVNRFSSDCELDRVGSPSVIDGTADTLWWSTTLESVSMCGDCGLTNSEDDGGNRTLFPLNECSTVGGETETVEVVAETPWVGNTFPDTLGDDGWCDEVSTVFWLGKLLGVGDGAGNASSGTIILGGIDCPAFDNGANGCRDAWIAFESGVDIDDFLALKLEWPKAGPSNTLEPKSGDRTVSNSVWITGVDDDGTVDWSRNGLVDRSGSANASVKLPRLMLTKIDWEKTK